MLQTETVGSLRDDPLVCYTLIQPSEIIFLFGFLAVVRFPSARGSFEARSYHPFSPK